MITPSLNPPKNEVTRLGIGSASELSHAGPIRNFCRPVAAAVCLAACAIMSRACAIPPGSTPAASGPKQGAEPVELAQARSATRATPSSAPFEFESAKNSIALLARDLSAVSSRSIVVMNGLEPSQAGPYEKKKRTAAEWVIQIAADAGMRVEHYPAYDYIFAPGYEAVAAAGIPANLHAGLGVRRTTLHIEFGTPFFAALALLSHSLQTAIVADNIVADARCGEMHLHNVAVADALEALLKSARIPERSIHVRSEADYTFLYSAGRPLRERLRVEGPGDSKPDWLEKRVTLYLPAAPADPGHLQGYGRAVPLSECLAEFERQTGVHVEADARALALPINPAVMPQVRITTALELIIHQWPLPHFGYRTEANTLRFVYLGPPVED